MSNSHKRGVGFSSPLPRLTNVILMATRYWPKYIPHCKVINQLLIKLDPSRLDDGSGFETTLRQTFAKVTTMVTS